MTELADSVKIPLVKENILLNIFINTRGERGGGGEARYPPLLGSPGNTWPQPPCPQVWPPTTPCPSYHPSLLAHPSHPSCLYFPSLPSSPNAPNAPHSNPSVYSVHSPPTTSYTDLLILLIRPF